MARFTFTPNATSIDPAILSAKSTTAKVVFHPHEIYVDATIARVNEGSEWQVEVEHVPRQMNVSEDNVNAVLCLTKGELGKVLGTVALGNVHV
ncbi:hypothetical protein H2200_005158 [Cladophialophora chaetospira]|uniref:Uncharacterized protein n=1 Tax=Cladophialophora chaetospira TaxID=386627 RepID=A0AA39CJJ8_9EURO|nr:hypothetical protein H2200_005158 [Cladophialophora chaetospira]